MDESNKCSLILRVDWVTECAVYGAKKWGIFSKGTEGV